MSNARAPRAGRRTDGRASDRAAADRCGAPDRCSRPALHVVVDPVYGGRFGACEVHWPDLAATIFVAGGWVSGCPCADCTR